MSYRYIKDVQLKRCVTDLLGMFKPIVVSLDNLQKIYCTLGNVFEIWHYLRQTTRDEYMFFVTERAKKALTPEVLAANLLDHRYAGIHFDSIRLLWLWDT